MSAAAARNHDIRLCPRRSSDQKKKKCLLSSFFLKV
jgi:hypothetical protein